MNIPNQLTVARFVLTLVFLGLASVPIRADGSHQTYWIIGLVVAVVAGTTDFLDGYIARKYNLITDFGKLMDPLSDKIFTVSCFVVLTAHDIVPAWVTVAILAREFAVTGLRSLAAGRGQVMAAAAIGKFKTVFQMIILGLGGMIWVGWLPPGQAWWQVALCFIAVYTLYTGVDYYYRNRDLYLNQM